MNIKASDVVAYLKEEKVQHFFKGNKNLKVNSFSSIKNINNYNISWIKDIESFDLEELQSFKSVLIVCNDFELNNQLESISFICCDNPKKVFFSILESFFSQKRYERYISDKAIVESETIGENVYIGHNSYIGREVSIGDNVVIKNNVSLEGEIKIGNNTIIHSGVIIGTDGFGYYQDGKGINQKVAHYGGVIIGQNVEIGSNTCIDRGTLDNTVIQDYVKINNLCHIAHNVIIKKNVTVTAGTIITGSTQIGENTYIAPGSIIRNQLKIGDNSYIGMGSVVVKHVNNNKLALGVPAKEIKDIK
jgi:UDP-3-O-[3-hydroxymyristoyl] glucosamine N-acyltransferase